MIMSMIMNAISANRRAVNMSITVTHNQVKHYDQQHNENERRH